MIRTEETIIPIYNIALTIIECSENEELEEFLKKHFNPDFKLKDALAHTAWDIRKVDELDYNCIYLIFDNNNKYHKIDNAIIAHEAFHACDFVCEIIKNEFVHSELMAYLMQYIVKETTNFLKL